MNVFVEPIEHLVSCWTPYHYCVVSSILEDLFDDSFADNSGGLLVEIGIEVAFDLDRAP